MEDKQLQKNEFVREKIKDKPKNYKRLWIKLLTAAGCGIVFALTAVLVMLFMLPTLHGKMQENMPQTQLRDSQTDDTQDTPAETQSEEDTQETQTQNKEFTIDDYQKIQTQLYAIGNLANKSIVTITSVVSDTDWFNNSYEREGQGSGTIIGDEDGKLLILTERRIIKDASKISVTFIDDTVAPAELIKYDGNTGLAVLEVEKTKMESSTISVIGVMSMGNSNSVHKGSIVIALGSPLGTNYSILTGSITSTSNEISTEDCNYSVYTTDIVANKNGSGILINTDGEMIGVVMQNYSAASTGALTAVDANELKEIIALLSDSKDVPYLGVHISTVTEKIANTYGIPKGVYIKEVEMDSPAMNAGLQSGDVILKIDDQDITTADSYTEAVLGLTLKETYSVVFMREGSNGYKELTCDIEAGILK
ncbi:MAG: S1C family serine protease [Lachnobacterium sp.]|nr:S1C family serine protease [Lachnobacterium sp.]MDD7714098.1 S1C family serine protease [Lachnobacterium sp.]MDY5460826.1 S1C family serine protease [Agathobacter sp.]